MLLLTHRRPAAADAGPIGTARPAAAPHNGKEVCGGMVTQLRHLGATARASLLAPYSNFPTPPARAAARAAAVTAATATSAAANIGALPASSPVPLHPHLPTHHHG